MLETIRKSISGILAKVLIALLVVSFAVWGIGDMVTGYGRDTVASVGSETISTNEFRRAYQTQIDLFSRQFGRRLTPQEAKTFGVEQQVLARLTGSASVDNHAQELNLAISDKALEQGVYADPMFQGLDGNFSAQRLGQLLYQSGYTEKQFFEARRRDTLRAQLTNSMLAGVTPPKAMVNILRTYQGEQRTAEYIEVKAEKVVTLGTPNEAALKKTYDDNKRQFVEPEYRKFQALLLTAAAAKAKLEISDADLKSAYEADREGFRVAEERRIQQIPFDDKAAAAKAKAELDAGKSFEDVAKAANVKKEDYELGLMTKDGLIDKKVAEAAFKLEKDKVSAPIDGQFKTMLLRVSEIKEGRVRPFDEVKADLRRQIENDRVADKIQEIQNNIDDNRLAGKSLKEISEIVKLPFFEAEKADRQGNTPDAKPAITIIQGTDRDQLVRTAFGAEVGVENEVIQLSNDGFAWINLIAVTPEKQKAFENVQDDVKKTWTALETQRILREEATALAKRVNDGATLSAIAYELGVEVKTTPLFKRGDSVPDFQPPAVARVFALQEGQAATTTTADDKTRLIVRVTKIAEPKPATADALKALKEQTAQQMQGDVVTQYVAELRKRMDVSVNQSVVDLTTGAAVPTNNY